MNICIPVIKDRGSESRVSPHFGSAPLFMLVNTDTGACSPLPNQNQHYAHGQCRPLASLSGQDIQGVVVGGIGMGAFSKLSAAGIEVFISDRKTVGETVAAFKDGTLNRVTSDLACHGHGQGQGRGQGRGCGSGQVHGRGRGRGRG